MVKEYGISVRNACRAVRPPRSCYYSPPAVRDDTEVIERIEADVRENPRQGFDKLYSVLRRPGCGKKRLYRVYCQLELNLKRRGKRRLPSRIKEPLQVPSVPNAVWTIDFMADALWKGRRFRTFNVLDDFNREALWIEIEMSMLAGQIVRVLTKRIEIRGKPLMLRMDNCPELISAELEAWARQQGIRLLFILPGKLNQNAYIERLNRTYRNEVLDCYVFETLDEVRRMTADWLARYNDQRPHESLGNLSPRRYLMARSK